MTEASRDTLTTARPLEHEFGMDEWPSEEVARTIYEMRREFKTLRRRRWLMFGAISALIVTFVELSP